MTPELFVLPPGHPLRPHVAHIFRVRARGTYAREIVLPRAGVEVLFNLGDPFCGAGAANGGSTMELTTTRVGGVRTGPLHVRPTGVVDLVGVSLRAECCAELLPVPAHELTSVSVEGDAVYDGVRELRERLGEAADFRAQCAILESWLLARRRPDRRADAVRWACGELRRDASDRGVSRVAEGLAVSPRHLRRLLTERVGVGPAAYVRLRRFTDALPLLHRRSHRTLSDVAHAAGYYDQPHFCRDFKTFAGMTPHEYLRVRGPVPGNVFLPS